MKDGIDGLPKFPGDLSDHLPQRDERPDRWTDRVRHAWLLYAILAVIVPTWVGAMVAAVVILGSLGWPVALMILILPAGLYVRVLQWRFITGRDVNTGERINPRDR